MANGKLQVTVDGRVLLDPAAGGVYAYASNLLDALRRRGTFAPAGGTGGAASGPPVARSLLASTSGVEAASGPVPPVVQGDGARHLRRQAPSPLIYHVWANRSPFGPYPADPRLDFVTGWPNRLLNASLLLTRRPKLDAWADPTAATPVFWMPNLNFAAFSGRARVALTVHDLSFERHPEFFSLKQRAWHAAVRPRNLCRRADVILAVSAHTKRDLVELYGIAPEKIRVAYPGVTDVFRSPIAPERLAETRRRLDLPERFVLHVGALEPRKNHLGLLDAFALIRKNPAHEGLGLVLAGPPGWKNSGVTRAIAHHPNRADIRRLGFVGEEDKAALYRLAAAFAFPSFYEGFGLPPLEAMASGTPVVASCASSLGEVVGDAVILIDPYRPAELADALQSVLESPALAAELARRGKEKAQAFTWDACAEAAERAFLS